MHAYDYDCVADHTLIARRAKAGETLTTLDGNERELNRVHAYHCRYKGPNRRSRRYGWSY